MARSRLIVLAVLAASVMFSTGCPREQRPEDEKKAALPAMTIEECEARFKTMDTYGDYLITYEEFVNAPEPVENPEEAFKSLDTNGDGVLTVAELCAEAKKPEAPNR